jgi:hypothetical protein
MKTLVDEMEKLVSDGARWKVWKWHAAGSDHPIGRRARHVAFRSPAAPAMARDQSFKR